MNNYIVSIVMPVYNVEEYIEETLESIISQSIGFDNLELIMVNDASTDNSLSIVESYSKRYENIKIINLLKPSKAPGKPRNIGLSHVNSEYCMFIDADDILIENGVEILYSNAKKLKSDIVCGQFVVFNNETENNIFKELNLKDVINTNVIDSKFLLQIPNNLGSKLYKTKFIKDNNIIFHEGVAAQDAFFVTKSYLLSNRITFICENIFKYRIRTSANMSITQNRNKKYFNDFNFIRKELIELYDSNEELNYFDIRFVNDLKWLLYQLEYCNAESSEEKIDILKSLQWFIDFINIDGIKDLNIPSHREEFLLCLHNKEYERAIKFMNNSKHNLFANF